MRNVDPLSPTGWNEASYRKVEEKELLERERWEILAASVVACYETHKLLRREQYLRRKSVAKQSCLVSVYLYTGSISKRSIRV